MTKTGKEKGQLVASHARNTVMGQTVILDVRQMSTFQLGVKASKVQIPNNVIAV